MSSMRNAVQRRNHKERAQPREREKWGILEKHKDYSLRAADYNAKKTRLKHLRQKAADRNEDEFHYGMLSHSSKGGRKIVGRGNEALSDGVVKLLKTQDAGYLRTILLRTRRMRERAEEEFVVGSKGEVEVYGGPNDGAKWNKKGGHVVFVESEEEQQDMVRREEKRGALEPSNEDNVRKVRDNMQPVPKSRRALARQEEALKKELHLRKKHKKEQEAQRSKLAAMRIREKELMNADRELELQRAKMSNNIGGVNKNGVRWKVRERKR